MAGFLDPKERVIDLVLTSEGKKLLMKGELRFTYWVPFDDEVDYLPISGTTYSTSSAGQTYQQRSQELTESPLVREATMGYRGLNLVEEDLTNVHRPMFTAVPGVGLTAPLPQAVIDEGPVTVEISQKKLLKTYIQKDHQGRTIGGQIGPVLNGFQRSNGSEFVLNATYSTGSFTQDSQYEGFLVTVYESSSLVMKSVGTGVLQDTYDVSGSGGHREVLHNRDSKGNIVYRNDITLNVYTP